MTAAVKAIFTELGLSSIPVRLPQVVTNDGLTIIIALYNNYSMKKRHTDEDARKLAGFLGKEGEQPSGTSMSVAGSGTKSKGCPSSPLHAHL